MKIGEKKKKMQKKSAKDNNIENKNLEKGKIKLTKMMENRKSSWVSNILWKLKFPTCLQSAEDDSDKGEGLRKSCCGYLGLKGLRRKNWKKKFKRRTGGAVGLEAWSQESDGLKEKCVCCFFS